MTPGPITARATAGIARAAEDMRLAGIHHIPVVDEHGFVIGMLSHVDVAAALSRRGRQHVRVAAAMSHPPITVRARTPLKDAIGLLLRHRIHALPVVGDGEQLIGIVTETDLLRVAYEALGGVVEPDGLVA